MLAHLLYILNPLALELNALYDVQQMEFKSALHSRGHAMAIPVT